MLFRSGNMQDEIFNLLMLILMLENGGGEANINQMILMFLMMNSKTLPHGSSQCSCSRDDGFTF